MIHMCKQVIAKRNPLPSRASGGSKPPLPVLFGGLQNEKANRFGVRWAIPPLNLQLNEEVARNDVGFLQSLIETVWKVEDGLNLHFALALINAPFDLVAQ